MKLTAGGVEVRRSRIRVAELDICFLDPDDFRNSLESR